MSRQLRLLEEDLGVPLFERERHGMVLTDFGKALLVYARRTTLELDRFPAAVGGTSVDRWARISQVAQTASDASRQIGWNAYDSAERSAWDTHVGRSCVRGGASDIIGNSAPSSSDATIPA